MSNTENEKVAAEPDCHEKPATLDGSENDKDDAQEREKMSVTHAVRIG